MATNSYATYRAQEQDEGRFTALIRNVNLPAVVSKLGFVLIAAGLIIIGVAWNGAAGHITVVQQMPYLLSGGFLGLAIVVYGAALLVMQAQRADRQRLEAKLDELIEVIGRGGTTSGTGTIVGTRGSVAKGDLVVAGASAYHTQDCRLVDGREETERITRDEARERGMTPCRVCKPDA